MQSRISSFISANKKRYEVKNQVLEEYKLVEAKKKRCLEEQEKMEHQEGCVSCMSWVMYWGQINSLYSELEGFLSQLSQIE